MMRRQQGFTLIELLVAMLIAAIILGLGAPAFGKVIRENRAMSAAGNLISGLNTARAEAIRRGKFVTLCPSANGTTCSNNWADGWLIAVDNAATATAAPVIAPADVLQVGSAMTAITATRTVGLNNWVRFSSRGGTSEAITVQVKPSTCPTNTVFRSVSIGISGRASIDKSKC